MADLQSLWASHSKRAYIIGASKVANGQTIYLIRWSPGFAKVTTLDFDGGEVVGCREGTILTTAKELQEMVKDGFVKADLDEIPLSVGIRGFGLEGVPEFAVESVNRFVDNLDTAASSPEVVEELRKKLLDVEKGRFLALAERVRSVFNGDAIEALSAVDEYALSDYKFYTVDGDKGLHRRQAAQAYPILAGYFSKRPALRRAIDNAQSLNATIMSSFGDGMTKGLLKRIQNIRWPAKGIDPDRLMSFLKELPVDWIPSEKKEWDSLCDLLATGGVFLGESGSTSLDKLFSGAGGKWSDYALRVAKAYTDTRPPEGLTEQEMADWERRPVTYDVRRSTMKNASIDAESMIRVFANQVVLPLAAQESGVGEVILGFHHQTIAYEIAKEWLFGGKSVGAVYELSRHWHSQEGRIENEIMELGGGDQPEEARLITEDHSWPPILTSPAQAPNGVVIQPLFTKQMLIDEGGGYGSTPSVDALGANGLNHCVSTHASSCMNGSNHILGFRIPIPGGSFKRLSTIEIRRFARGDRIEVVQHRGPSNSAPGALSDEAWDWFLAMYQAGQAPINWDLEMKFSGDSAGMAIGLQSICGYDWHSEQTIKKVMGLWAEYVNKKLRKMPFEEIRASEGIVKLAEAIMPGYSTRRSVAMSR